MASTDEHSRLIRYALLQSTIGPSLICDIFVFIHFIRHWRKEIIQSPQNHSIICLLILSFIQKTIEMPFILYYYRWGISIQQNDTFCTIWNWLDFTLITNPLQVWDKYTYRPPPNLLT